MENLRANHFESRDSGLNKNEFNLSAKSGRSVGKGKLCAAKIIRGCNRAAGICGSAHNDSLYCNG